MEPLLAPAILLCNRVCSDGATGVWPWRVNSALCSCSSLCMDVVSWIYFFDRFEGVFKLIIPISWPFPGCYRRPGVEAKELGDFIFESIWSIFDRPSKSALTLAYFFELFIAFASFPFMLSAFSFSVNCLSDFFNWILSLNFYIFWMFS